MKNKTWREKIKKEIFIIITIISLVLFKDLYYYSYAKESNVTTNESENNYVEKQEEVKEQEKVNSEDKEDKEIQKETTYDIKEYSNELIVTTEYIYNKEDNTITGMMHSNNPLKDTKISWELSEDQLTYTTILRSNGSYTTTVEDIYGNIAEVLIEVKGIDETGPKITMEYKYNPEDNTVTGIMHSNEKLGDTKPTWTLGADQLTYSKNFDADTTYTTPVEDIYGNVTQVLIEVTQISAPPTITMEYIFNENDNTVTGIMHSNKKLKDTKISWELSENQLTYTTILRSNGSYTTTVEDLWGRVVEVFINVTLVDEKGPEITMEYKYNPEDNTVTGIMHSNEKLKNTKISWELSEDQLTYTTILRSNGSYTTTVEDIYGNVTEVLIDVTQVDEKGPEITMEYKYNPEDNTVTGIMHSNEKLKNTKVSWVLSNDKLTYTTILRSNGSYTTTVEDIYGNSTEVLIEVTQIDEEPPKITMEYVYNENNTVTAIMHSNEIMADTKPTWTLSEDKLSYSKTFDTNMNYETPVEDIYGNEIWVRVVIKISGNASNFYDLDESKYPGYKQALQNLQKQHPNWIITIDYTGLDWNTVLTAEQQMVGDQPKSLTQYTNEWRDGDTQYQPGWYKASRAAIAYMMDPRNSLDDGYVFQFQDLSSSAGTYSDIEKMIKGTFLENYEKNGVTTTKSIIDTILSCSSTYNISPYHLISRMLLEQGSGSPLSDGYEYNGRKVYNLFNMQASGATEEEIYKSGAEYAYNNHWFSPETAISGGARFLNSGYLSQGQTTLYYQKYNVVNEPYYDNQYMQNIRAANDEGKMISDEYKESGLINGEFEFLIPVYENMPSTASPRPAQ